MPTIQCNQTFLSYNEKADNLAFRNGISVSQYCAYDPKKITDSCNGDSGGPLQVFLNNNSYVPHVVGIVSFGVGCGSEYPTIYTRVASYLDWIAPHVWPQ